ncbi:MAG: hypothetical protein FWD57_09380 [Polyangiaceae bacterium]|nr:hypothetical protein [Polyangiaceae bacterium]
MCPLALATIAWSSAASAEVSSWVFVGGGANWLSERASGYEMAPSMQIDVGMGSPPSRSFVVGMLGRTITNFGRGTDLALALRGTTGGFSRGGYGVAVDLGMYRRWWGMGSWGPIGSLHLGGPYGLQLTGNVEIGTQEHRTFGVLFGVDLLRLTVHRPAHDKWWMNPRPSWR